MDTLIQRGRPVWLFVMLVLAIASLALLGPSPNELPVNAAAHAGDVFGPACGAATIDGVVHPEEWGSASRRTFQMVKPGGGVPFTATLYVMNTTTDLYLGITINDDEFTTVAQYLPQGDGFRIDFDNDHSGSLFAVGDEVLGVGAGAPQFQDLFISEGTSASLDSEHGGTTDGVGAASRVGNLNHFELRHPLCSGDSLDFCLHHNDIVGFRLEYLDAEANGTYGGSQFYPGLGNTAIADMVIGLCFVPHYSVSLPLIRR